LDPITNGYGSKLGTNTQKNGSLNTKKILKSVVP
jgi:hypothetical protein